MSISTISYYKHLQPSSASSDPELFSQSDWTDFSYAVYIISIQTHRVQLESRHVSSPQNLIVRIDVFVDCAMLTTLVLCAWIANTHHLSLSPLTSVSPPLTQSPTERSIVPQILYPDASAWHCHHNHEPDAMIDEIAAAIRRADPTQTTTTTTTTSVMTMTENSPLVDTTRSTSTSSTSLYPSSGAIPAASVYSSPLLPLMLVLKRKIRSFIVESR